MDKLLHNKRSNLSKIYNIPQKSSKRGYQFGYYNLKFLKKKRNKNSNTGGTPSLKDSSDLYITKTKLKKALRIRFYKKSFVVRI